VGGRGRGGVVIPREAAAHARCLAGSPTSTLNRLPPSLHPHPRWPPHINLLYPFVKDEGTAFEAAAARAAEALRGIEPFEVRACAGRGGGRGPNGNAPVARQRAPHPLHALSNAALYLSAPASAAAGGLWALRPPRHQHRVAAARPPGCVCAPRSQHVLRSNTLALAASARLRSCAGPHPPPGALHATSPHTGVIAVQAALQAAFPDCDDLSNDPGRGIAGFAPHMSLGQWRGTAAAEAATEEVRARGRAGAHGPRHLPRAAPSPLTRGLLSRPPFCPAAAARVAARRRGLPRRPGLPPLPGRLPRALRLPVGSPTGRGRAPAAAGGAVHCHRARPQPRQRGVSRRRRGGQRQRRQ
jgi:hypothetical protein